MRFRLLGAALAAVLAGMAVSPVPAGATAVVLMYHRFGESHYPSTSITLEQFDAHLAELESGGYNVVPVPDIIAALKAGRELPDRTVGITVDDAYLSVYAHAWPRLKEAKLPFTLFVATDAVDRATSQGAAGYMTWDQVREMAASGVTIGSQTASHLHMPVAGAERNRAELTRSNDRFATELGKRPDIFAYPYGEASLAVEKLVAEAGFVASFGQHSGAVGSQGDLYNLPRFALNENYGDIDRFRLVVNTLPLPVSDITPVDPLITDNNPPAIGFTVAGDVGDLARMSCFVSPDKATIERLGDTRIEVRITHRLPKGRTRLNCTMPARDGRWRWYGRQFVVSE